MEKTNKKFGSGFVEPHTESQIRRAKRTNLVAVTGLLLMLGLTFFFLKQLSATKRELEQNKRTLEDRNDSLAAMQDRQAKLIVELNNFKDEMARREQKAWRVVDSLANSLKDRNYREAQAIAADYDSSSSNFQKRQNAPLVNLYSYQAPEPILHIVRNYLEKQKIKVLKSVVMKEMSKWLLDHSTVEYYDLEMKARAERIAKELSHLTKTPFKPIQSPELVENTHMRWINVVVVGQRASDEIRQINAPYIQMQMEPRR